MISLVGFEAVQKQVDQVAARFHGGCPNWEVLLTFELRGRDTHPTRVKSRL